MNSKQYNGLSRKVANMNKLISNLALFALMGPMAIAQTPGELESIKSELHDIYIRDQKTRTEEANVDLMRYMDSCNLVQVEQIIEAHGWLGKSQIGEAGNTTLWLIIQHADLAIQEKYFPLLLKSVEAGESRTQDLALLQDRILMRQGKKQLYGSQVVFNKTTGEQEFYPIDEEYNVNDRRKKMGMEPLESYAKHFGINYTKPAMYKKGN